jgi:hypothetical protein
MSATDILAWHDYFAVVAQIGATLAGLLFVGLTISLEHLLQARGYLARAFAALFLQLEILLIGLFGLIPAQPQWAFGIELILVGTALFIGIETFSRNFPEDDQSDVLGTKPFRILRALLNVVSTLSPAAAGIALIAGWRGALYLLIPAVLACVYMSIGYAWVFAVEIPRRRELAKKEDSQNS